MGENCGRTEAALSIEVVLKVSEEGRVERIPVAGSAGGGIPVQGHTQLGPFSTRLGVRTGAQGKVGGARGEVIKYDSSSLA